MEKNKRRHERVEINQKLELSTSEGIVVSSQGVNVSESGLLCRADMGIPAGTYVMFHMSIPSGKTTMSIQCEGTVLRCTENNGKFDIVIDFTDACDCM